jgi:TRAP-type C4-dicarboxylate transport system permease large subunit
MFFRWPGNNVSAYSNFNTHIYSLGIDIVHFGITMIMGLMIGLITPPFGPSLFIVAEVGNISLKKLFYSIFPFVILLIISLLIIILFPDLIMFLPNLYY